MSSIQLLDKTRKIGRLLHSGNSDKLIFNDVCRVLGEILGSNALVISKKGKLLGISNRSENNTLEELITDSVGLYIDVSLNERLLSILSTKENINLETLGFESDNINKYHAIVSPIDISGDRLGTLFLYKCDSEYDINDIILTEYGTVVVGLEMVRAINEETAEENRRQAVVHGAMETLSFSELEAIVKVFDELGDMEGLLVASRVADKAGITRSVIVNALRKFESAGVIESRSSGMKGTYIKVLNDAVYAEIERVRKENHF